MNTHTTAHTHQEIDRTLAYLAGRFGDDFNVTAEQIGSDRPDRQGEHLSTVCLACDVPKDVCTSCDATDITCNNQHDLVCIRCDEGDVCIKKDNACNLAGDISCGPKDTCGPGD